MIATHPRRLIVSSAAIVVAALLTVLAVQFARRGPPFSPRETAPAPLPQGGQHQGHDMPSPGTTPLPHGYAAVNVEPSQLAPLALSTALIEETDVTRTLRTVGVVGLDETRTAHVHSKVRGWIDKLAVSYVGQQVKPGDVLCTIYSQEVYSAEIELLSVQGQPGPLLQAARRRLALWDVPRAEIDRLERSREPRQTFPLLAPRPGIVVAKQALQGMYVDASLELYTLSDLSRIWVQADIYEADVPFVAKGASARLRIGGASDFMPAQVAFLSPTLDEATRTRKVRFELPNADGKLLPGSFVTVELEVQLGRARTVPESAVIRTGTRSIVFVAGGDPPTTFEPREVKLGALVGDAYLIESGLEPGERLATGAQFLLDSESRVRASSRPGGAHGGH